MENHRYGYHPRGRTRHFSRVPRSGKRSELKDVIYMGQHNLTAVIEGFRAQHGVILCFYKSWFSQVFQSATGLNIPSQPFKPEEKVLVDPWCTMFRFGIAVAWPCWM